MYCPPMSKLHAVDVDVDVDVNAVSFSPIFWLLIPRERATVDAHVTQPFLLYRSLLVCM